MFSLMNAGKSYGGVAALQPTNLVIPSGQTVVLIGPSGCGKSTILRLMSGLIRPDTGEVRFENKQITAENLPAVRHRTGYVIQDGGLFPHLTGRENAGLLARHLGRDQSFISDQIEKLTTLTRLSAGVLDRYPAEMSGGQRQRVALIRALMLDPDALLLDEPLGALDPMVRFELQNDLSEIFRTLKKTVVMVTHDLAEAAFFADVIVIMKDGRIVQRGTPDEVLRHPADAFVEQFVRAQRSPLERMGGGK